MSTKAGEYLRHDPIKLRFTTTHATNSTPKSILKRALNQSIAEIMAPSYINPATTIILYEKLDVSIVELETKRSLKVIWTGIHNREEAMHSFLLPKTSMVHELADHLAKLVALTPGGTGKIRVFEVSKDGKMQKEFTGTEMIGNIPEVELYAEEIPREELEADESDKVISVFHFSKDLTRTHGVPFKFVVKRGEKFSETKKRLQTRIGVSDKDLAKYRFALIQVSTFKQPSYIEDEDTIYDHQFAPEDVLGLDHLDKSGKTRTGGAEKAIVIRG
jgi:ubiquitin carboxyl-terminal hydrolase 7